MSPRRAEWILALAGFCLILLQFFMIRELTALLMGTELVILFITLAYFSGYSVGFGFARRLSLEMIRRLAILRRMEATLSCGTTASSSSDCSG